MQLTYILMPTKIENSNSLSLQYRVGFLLFTLILITSLTDYFPLAHSVLIIFLPTNVLKLNVKTNKIGGKKYRR